MPGKATEVESHLGSTLGRRLNRRKSGDRSSAYPTAFTFRGERRSSSCLFPFPCAHVLGLPRVHLRTRIRAALVSAQLSPATRLPSAASSPMPPAPMSPAPTSLSSAMARSLPRPFPRPTAAFRSPPEPTGRFFLVVSAKAFANCRHPTSTPASSTQSSATWCLSRHGCANRSWSQPPEHRLRSRRPAPPPPCLARSILPFATISSALSA